jgi:hypothetical protein
MGQWTLAATTLFMTALASAAQAGCEGASNCAIVIRLAHGTDTIVLTGSTEQNVDCCDYVFYAHAGQKLYYRIEGAAVRTVITYPNGDAEGPGLPNPLPLPANGIYVFGVHPNLMAEDAFGPFKLTLSIR